MQNSQITQKDSKQFFHQVLSSFDNYQSNHALFYSDSQKIKVALSSAYNMLKEPRLTPIQKKLCMLVLRDLLKMQHPQLTKILQKTLTEVSKVAIHHDQSESQRGQNYFNTDNAQIGIDFVRLATEFICFGNQVYPLDQDGKQSQFNIHYLKLKENNIDTDIEFIFFNDNIKEQPVSSNIQIQKSNISEPHRSAIIEQVHEDDQINQIHSSLIEVDNVKSRLKHIFSCSDIQQFQFNICEQCYVYLKEYVEQAQNHIQYLLSQPESVGDQYIQVIFSNSDFANTFVMDYENWNGQQISLNELIQKYQKQFK